MSEKAIIVSGVLSADTGISEFIESRLSPRTRMAYASDIQDFFAFRFNRMANNTDLRGVSLHDAVQWRESLRARGLAGATVNRKLTAMNTLFEYAVGAGLVQHNPFSERFLERVKVRKWNPKMGLAGEEATRLIASCLEDEDRLLGLRDRAIMALGFTALLRREEIVSISRGDFYQDKRNTLLRLPSTKGGENDRVVVIPEAMAAIDEYLAEAAPVFARSPLPFSDQPVFVSLSNRNYGERLSANGLYKVIVGRAKAAGFDVHVNPHLMRHTGITMMLERGGALHRVQMAARHTDPATTQLYNRNLKNLDNSPTQLLGDFLGG